MVSGPLGVFYNASALPRQEAGAGVYTLELGRALAARESLRLDVFAPRDPGFGIWTGTPGGLTGRLAWEEFQLGRLASLREADVYHGPHFATPRTNRPAVATVHDLTFFRLPKRYDAAHRAYYRRLARTAKRARRLIVPSGAVAADCVHYLGYPPERIRVVSEAPRAGLQPPGEAAVADFRRKHTIHGPYFACLGTAEPGKRAVDAIRAMSRILDHAPSAVLVLAGNPGPLSTPLQREAERLGVAGAVRFPGYLPDEDLAPFLGGAVALLFPSLFEGFGLPPLEALACGTPVVTTAVPAMDEVLGDGALFVPLRDPVALADAARSLLEPARREDLAARGLEFVRRFSWERAASETESVYREAAS